jgi:putative transcriptional regulator
MAIVVNLDVMMAKRKISLTNLSQRVGITMPNLSILKQGKARAIRFNTLDALCRELQCQPGDLLEYQPSASGAKGSSNSSSPDPSAEFSEGEQP